jgi:hypothetical protein
VPQPNDTAKMTDKIISERGFARDVTLFHCGRFSLLSCLLVNVSRLRE